MRDRDPSRHRPRRRCAGARPRSAAPLAPRVLVQGAEATRGTLTGPARSTDTRHPANVDAVLPEDNGHQVHTIGGRVEPSGQTPDLDELVVVEVDNWIGNPRRGGRRLHLDGDTDAVVMHDQVDLTSANRHVPTDDQGTSIGQEGSSNQFADSPDALLAQSWVVGSSSSMFTSRNVITLTRFTKRAGRYMSHTQASSSSSSK